jgi:hypothetical protein
MDGVGGGGTLGGFLVEYDNGDNDVRRDKLGRPVVYGLTNAHVLRSRRDVAGQPIYEVRPITQPAPSDGVRTRLTALDARESLLLEQIRRQQPELDPFPPSWHQTASDDITEGEQQGETSERVPDWLTRRESGLTCR